MKVTRKLMMAAGALVLPLAAVATVGVGTASAARSGQVTGTGAVTCTTIHGTITFNPPLATGGTAAETTSVTATATGCTGGTPNPTQVNSTATITGGTNSCTALATAAPPTLTGTYLPAGSLNPSSTVGGTETEQVSPHLGFTISGATTTGSFANGATHIVVQTTETLKAFNKTCKKGKKKDSKGVKSFTIGSGTVTNL